METLVGVDETVGDKTGLPSGDANIIASINRIDSKTQNTNFHTHNNKAILDSITQDNINSWNEKVVTTPSGQVVYKAPVVNLFNYTTVQRDTVNGVTGYYSDYINYENNKKYKKNMYR